MTEKNKAVFLDRDGTINFDYGYVGKIEQFVLIPGVVEALKLLQEKGFLLFVVSNQSGINRGYYTHEDLKSVHELMVKVLGEHGIEFKEAFYCPHRPDEKCDCRKPSPKFVHEMEEKFNIDLSNSYFIGDRDSDILAGKNSGTKTIFIAGGPGKVEADYVARDLQCAAHWILESSVS